MRPWRSREVLADRRCLASPRCRRNFPKRQEDVHRAPIELDAAITGASEGLIVLHLGTAGWLHASRVHSEVQNKPKWAECGPK